MISATCALLLGLSPPTFTLYDEYTDIRGLSPKATYACGTSWTGSVYGTACWPVGMPVRTSKSFAKGESCPIAVAVDDLGDVICQMNLGTRNEFRSAGYRWLKGGIVERLKTFSPQDQCWPRAISRNGSLIVGTIFDTDMDWPVAWKRDGSIVRLQPTKKPKKSFGEALGISGNGRVIVGHIGNESGQVAAIWTDLGLPKRLDDLPGGKVESYAWTASFDGSVVAGYATDDRQRVPVRWVRAGKAIRLGIMPSQYESGMARGISDDGSIIIGLWGFGKEGQGFVWTASTGMVAASDFLSAHGLGSKIAGLKVVCVLGVSADGHTIAGSCMDSKGKICGFRATF
jgi:uncharacterized membrane protein